MPAEPNKPYQQKTVTPNSLKFIFGGASAMIATLLLHPNDVLKIRMQTAGVGTKEKVYSSSLDALQKTVKKEGFLVLYSGLSAGLARQAVYSTARIGIYSWAMSKYRQKYSSEPPWHMSAMYAIMSGGIGAFLGCPNDVALTRMATDGTLPPDQRRHYTHIFNAIHRIYKESGVKELWKGGGVTSARAMVVSLSQLSSYSQLKLYFQNRFGMSNGIGLYFLCSMISGILVAVSSLPLDIAKVRLQNQKKAEYRGTLDVFVKVVQKEGIFALWKGITPYYARVGPNTMIILLIMEQLYRMYFYLIGVPNEGSDL